MKTWIFLVLALILGVGLGMGRTWREFQGNEDYFAPTRLTPASKAARDAAAAEGLSERPAAKVTVVGGSDYDFGEMGRFGSQKHTFVIRNDGNQNLTLEEGASTCKCTVLNLGDTSNGDVIFVPPGEQVEVELEWTARGEAKMFRQAAELLTNDPVIPSVRLRVMGRVLQTIAAEPDELRFTSISSNTENRLTFVVWSKNPDFEIVNTVFGHPEFAEYFELELSKLSLEDLNSRWPQATAGYEGTVIVKPGLPTGDISQPLFIETNLEDTPEILMAIEGSVVSDLSVLGDRRFNKGQRFLELGSIRQSEGAEAQLYILIKGEQREAMKIEVESVTPAEVLNVELGEPKVGERTITRPLHVRVPPGAKPVTLLGTGAGDAGEIVLKTTHPQLKEIKIQVRFAVNSE